jgi:AcrR family transcriptional regulator
MATRGRPRSFDREKALLRAQELFWAAGYEGVTLSDLQKAMGGITAPSFYAAFGSKEQLFREAVELFREIEGVAPLRGLMESATARESIEAMLLAATDSCTQPGKPRGCLLVLGAINCAQSNLGVQEYLRDLRAQRQKVIQRRLERGVAEGDLPASANLAALASFYTTFVDGIALQARDGATRNALRATVRCAMAAWDGIVAATKRPKT